MRDSARQAPSASSQIVTLALPECSHCLGCRSHAIWVDFSPAALAEGLVAIGAQGITAATGEPLRSWWLQAGQACPAATLAGGSGGVSHRCSPSESCMGEGSIAERCRGCAALAAVPWLAWRGACGRWWGLATDLPDKAVGGLLRWGQASIRSRDSQRPISPSTSAGQFSMDGP